MMCLSARSNISYYGLLHLENFDNSSIKTGQCCFMEKHRVHEPSKLNVLGSNSSRPAIFTRFSRNIKKAFFTLYSGQNNLGGGFDKTEGLPAESSEAHKNKRKTNSE